MFFITTKYLKLNSSNLVNRICYFATRNSSTQHLNNLLLKMPRETKHILEAQQQRIKIKDKGSKYAPGTVNLQILGSGAPGAPASVYLFTDHTRYLFNCGEGTQRLAHEHKTKLARLEHIFITSTSWNQIGGLPGLSLTVQDSGVPELTLHGTAELGDLFRGMRRFVVLKNLKVNTIDCKFGGEYEDSIMTVKYIPLKKKGTFTEEDEQSNNENNLENITVDNTDYYSYESNSNFQQNNMDQKLSVNKIQKDNIVISYICKLKPKPGTLNLEKCVEKGVPPGPLLGQLKNGNDVSLNDGTVVRADEVRGATDPGAVFIFIDVPHKNYLESLEENGHLFKDYQSTTKNENNIALTVIHFSPQDIIETKIYQEFIGNFIPSTKHLILNASNQFSGNLAAHRIQWQLNQLNPYVFPILNENGIGNNMELIKNYKKCKLSDDSIDCNLNKSELKVNNDNTENAIKYKLEKTKAITCFHLRPRKGLDRSLELSIEPRQYIEEIHAVEGFTNCLETLKQTLKGYYSEVLNRVERENDYPKIVFLGTGSCIPNKTRNVSSILVHTTKNACILLDCGEGTLGQIIRFYGVKESIEILKNLKAIYISHLHADHHIGLIGILLARQKLPDVEPLLLLAPKQISSWLYFYNQIEPINKSYNLIPNDNLTFTPLCTPELQNFGINSIRTCTVHHCPYSYGISVDINRKELNKSDPIKITYSGDTMPCDNLINIGKNSTILIHEATMEDELLDEAKFKMHSTVSQALEQGNKMNAEYILLTHFSQRYAKLPRIKESLDSNVGIAFDNMEVTLNDLNCLHLMYPALKLMFNEHCEDMEQKALKRVMRKERKRQASISNSVK